MQQVKVPDKVITQITILPQRYFFWLCILSALTILRSTQILIFFIFFTVSFWLWILFALVILFTVLFWSCILFVLVKLRTNQLVMSMTWSSPIFPLRSHSLVCIENHLLIVVIGPIINKELEFIFWSDCSDHTRVYTQVGVLYDKFQIKL